jgi:hypothetical protein
MLRITIELVPGGDENRAAVIARGSISNVTCVGDLCDYVCSFEEHRWKGRSRGPYRAELTAWPRNERGAWEIVLAALSAAVRRTK